MTTSLPVALDGLLIVRGIASARNIEKILAGNGDCGAWIQTKVYLIQVKFTS